MNELALFAGAGGGILGGHLLGWRTVCAVERDAYAASVLSQRQNDGCLPVFPIWSDVRSFDGRPWRGIVDVVSGGFPCQDISAAGKGAGIEGERSGLWREMARIIGEVRPKFVFVENSPRLVGRGLAVVLGDLAAMGFDAEWFCVSAEDLGAPHERDRIWILAHANSHGCERAHVLLPVGDKGDRSTESAWCGQAAADACCQRLEGSLHLGDCARSNEDDKRRAAPRGIVQKVWPSDHPEPGILGMDDGLADWMDRIKAIGNGQVPRVAAAAWFIGSGEKVTNDNSQDIEK